MAHGDPAGTPSGASWPTLAPGAGDIADRPPADVVALRELVSRYGDVLDARAWEELSTIFTADVVFDVTDIGLPTVRGLDALIEYWDGPRAFHPAAHLITNVYVEALDVDAGVVRSRLLAVQGDGKVATGCYRDEVVRTPAGWRIARRTFRYTRRERPGAGGATSDHGHR